MSKQEEQIDFIEKISTDKQVCKWCREAILCLKLSTNKKVKCAIYTAYMNEIMEKLDFDEFSEDDKWRMMSSTFAVMNESMTNGTFRENLTEWVKKIRKH